MHQVLIVLDPNFGERLRAVWPGDSPIWIAMSPANEPVLRSLSAPSGVAHTVFRHDPHRAPEDELLSLLNTIELHHGPYSARPPYDALMVIGAKPTFELRQAMFELGLSVYEETSDGFKARRNGSR